MPYSYRIENTPNAPTFSLGDSFTVTITNDEDGSFATFCRIVTKIGKQVSVCNELGEFICSRKPKQFIGNKQGIQLPFHFLGTTLGLWVYSGPTVPAPNVPAPPARQERIREAEEAVARTEVRVREAQEALARTIEMRLRAEEEEALERTREATVRIMAEDRPTIPAHFLAEFMEMSLQLKRGHSCPCCFDVVTKETIYVSPCGHILCQGCHKGVMGTSKLCPTCRQEL